MNQVFKKNIINVYGDKGKKWLKNLPLLVKYYAQVLGLSELKENDNLTYNYILSGLKNNIPIILKLGLDHKALKQEGKALQAFKGHGAVKILRNIKDGLMLEQLSPGNSIKLLFRENNNRVIEILEEIIQNLHQANYKDRSFPHISQWLKILDNDWGIENQYLNLARIIKNQLIATQSRQVLLHGDLHHDNILQHNNSWIVIDPKGVIGDPEFEVATFLRNAFIYGSNTNLILYNLMLKLSKNGYFDIDRIKKWCFVSAVLSYCWGCEDKEENLSTDIIKVFYEIL